MNAQPGDWYSTYCSLALSKRLAAERPGQAAVGAARLASAPGRASIPGRIRQAFGLQPVPYYQFFPSTPRLDADSFDTWSSALVVENLGTNDAVVTITFYDPSGIPHTPVDLGQGRLNPFSLNPGESAEISTTLVATLPAGAYAAIVASDQPIVGINTLEGTSAGCAPVGGVEFTWTPPVPAVGQVVTFTGTVAGGDAPFTYTWNLGDGALASGQVVSHVYTASADYTVCLTVANCDDQYQESMCHIVTVQPGNITPTPSPTPPGTTATPTQTPTPSGPTETPTPVPFVTPTPTSPPPDEFDVFLPILFSSYSSCFPGYSEMEPNDDRLTANGPLCLGQNYSGFPYDEDDYFYLVSPGGTMTVVLQNYTTMGGQLLLYYEEEESARAFAVAPPYRLEYTGPAGKYYVRVYTPGGDVEAPAYTLGVWVAR